MAEDTSLSLLTQDRSAVHRIKILQSRRKAGDYYPSHLAWKPQNSLWGGGKFSSPGWNKNCCMWAASAILVSLQKSLTPASRRLDLQSLEKSPGKGEGQMDL